MAERRLHGLQRVLGVNALFSTAYGNVGSSIYYALGLVASYALGLTPVVFIITGFIFYLTAATYAEATAMYPEAGGSSSFARHAFNEFASFFAAWAQMLNYTVTIAISAFFVPHYLGGVLGIEPLVHAPGDVVFGIGVVIVLSLVNCVGVKESAGVNVLLAVIDFLTQLLLVLAGFFLVFSPERADRQHRARRGARRGRTSLLAIPIGMIAYTGHRDDLEHGRGGQGRDEDDPGRDQPRAHRGLRHLLHAAGRRAERAAGRAASRARPTRSCGPAPWRSGRATRCSGCPRRTAASPATRSSASSSRSTSARSRRSGELYVGLLAATILFIATNAGIIGVSRLVYSMGMHRQVPDRLRQLHPRYGTPWSGSSCFGAVACLIMIPGQADFLGSALRVRRDAVLHRRPRGGHQAPLVQAGPCRGPTAGRALLRVRGRELPLFAVLGGLGTGMAFAVTALLNLTSRSRASPGWRSASCSTCSIAATRGST